MEEKRPHLVLHFDVNKTLVMMDPAGGKGSVEEMISDLLSEIAYGTISDDGEWRPEPDHLGTTNTPPPDHPHRESLINYYDFLVRKFAADKPHRDRLRARFTEAGEPGAPFRPHYDTFLRAMRAAEWESAEPSVVDDDAAPAVPAPAPQYHYILPSFLHLLKHLKESGLYTFTLVFRTFGQDLPHLTQHFDEFCEGKHPLYRGFVMDGSDGQPDYRIQHKTGQHGTFFRQGREKHETHLVLGLWDQVPNTTKLEEWEGNVSTLEFYEGNERVKKVLTGFDAIHDHIHIDQNEASAHAIFFDDNIHFNGSQPEWMNIVDLRDKESGAPLALRDHIGRHLVKVEPAEAIRDVEYYRRAVTACLVP
ncbi:uncharacterized protein ACA1_163650 [Acanthamoeba castellanii str. Neff]|uniref:Uncharacterized protein n=1 Tax=Acanthamoeba castellanii (strain ATCC 30010 / Neff) TaxID=1257118 RepID=L8GRH1_ACACF|nr:uncharacterized protein ACA1_163650 [Acanthamoeba castellanii str. Neff]ELR15527.1 hypothetical protein ACA1_163650 [Acanthamoeba castellanii str. Neff]